MNGYERTSESGFSLVEILVVVVIMGLVMTSVFSLYLTQQRTANTSDEVIDVQQNLRIAYDMMARDVRMAGFGHSNPIAAAEGDRLVIRTPSPFNRYARIEGVYVNNSGAPGALHTGALADGETWFVKIPASQAQPLRAGNIFRVLRPQSGNYVGSSVSLEALSDPYRTGSGPYNFYLKVEVTGGLSADEYEVGDMGDMLARVPVASYDPYGGDTLEFVLADDPDSDDPGQKRLERNVSGMPTEILATKIAGDDGLHFQYLVIDDDDVVTLADTAWDEVLSDKGATEDQVIAIQVQLTGATDVTATGSAQMSGVKTREVLGRIQLKNRKIIIGGGI